jgi:putative FmdB family regulatory protein
MCENTICLFAFFCYELSPVLWWGRVAMPIYEYYCEDCNTIFNFLSRKVGTTRKPSCPKCGRNELERQISMFAVAGDSGDHEPDADLPIDESKMERAMEVLANDAAKLNEDDPRQAAQLMRKFSDLTGVRFSGDMEQALGRLESGEDPDQVEKEMGALMESGDDPLILPGVAGAKRQRKPQPIRDATLYEL